MPSRPDEPRRPERSAQEPTSPHAPQVQPSVPMEEGDVVTMRVESATPAHHEPPAPQAPAPTTYRHALADAEETPVADKRPVAPSAAHPGPPIPDPVPPVPAQWTHTTPVEVPVVTAPTPSVHAAPDAPAVVVAPTLGETFQMLCAALAPHLLQDAATYEHCALIRDWHGSSVASQHVAWSHAVQLLGRVLGKKIEA